MGNPVITRLGINQFWYKHWYADQRYHSTLKEDEVLTKLISFYLNYGSVFQSNSFIHEYWYRSNTRKVRLTDQYVKNLRSFQRYFYTNDRLGIEHSYFIRYRTGEYFPMRLWIMRFGNWIFISVHWFKPVKTKKINRVVHKKKYVGSVSKSSQILRTNKRLSLAKEWVCKNLNPILPYSF